MQRREKAKRFDMKSRGRAAYYLKLRRKNSPKCFFWAPYESKKAMAAWREAHIVQSRCVTLSHNKIGSLNIVFRRNVKSALHCPTVS